MASEEVISTPDTNPDHNLDGPVTTTTATTTNNNNQLRLRRKPHTDAEKKMPTRNHQGGVYDRLETGGTGGLSIRLGEILGSRGGGRRSSGQESLYSGYGGGSPGSERIRFTWKKLFIGAVVFVGLVWVVGPRMRRGWGGKLGKGQSTSGKGTDTTPFESELENFPLTNNTSNTSTTYYYDIDFPPSSSPLSYTTDRDPLGTTHCSSPFSPSLPLVQYALMIDAGSTGSRIHIYKFNNCRKTPSFEYEVFKMTQPGLSHYATSDSSPPEDVFAQRAAESLDVLLDEALVVVPKSLYHCTPVAVKATAGLRLLPGKRSEEILKHVERRVGEKYPFKLVDVVVMDGKDEGVFAWITVNYLVESIGAGGDTGGVGIEVEEEEGMEGKGREKRAVGGTTYAVLDLGGASTQIVFEPRFEHEKGLAMEEGEHKYDLVFSGEKHVLYQHSYLGYGLMSARKHVHRLVAFMDSVRGGNDSTDDIGNPCLSKGTRRRVEVVDEKTGEKKNVTMAGEDVGSFEGCSRLMQLVLAKDAICELKPCSFDGVYQPSLLTSFSTGKVLLLSYFYDRLHPLLPPSLPSPLTVSSIANISRDVCQGRDRWLTLWGSKPDVMKELEERPEYCLDLTFMYTLLRLGYEFEDERKVKIGKKIGGTELGWCLGAAINVIGAGEVTCRA